MLNVFEINLAIENHLSYWNKQANKNYFGEKHLFFNISFAYFNTIFA